MPTSVKNAGHNSVATPSRSYQRPAVAVIVAAIVLAIAALVLLPVAVLRLSRAAANNPRHSARAAAVLGFFWILLAVTGLQWSPGVPLASSSPVDLLAGQLRQLQQGLSALLGPLDAGDVPLFFEEEAPVGAKGKRRARSS